MRTTPASTIGEIGGGRRSVAAAASAAGDNGWLYARASVARKRSITADTLRALDRRSGVNVGHRQTPTSRRRLVPARAANP